jgi:putative ABC transport system ATP-binding protein
MSETANGKPAPDSGKYRNGNDLLIELRSVYKAYKTPAGDFPALKNIDLTIDAGEFVVVLGKSGSGKTTLINMLSGIDRPSSGEVFIGDAAVHAFNESQMARWRGRTVGVVFQFFQLLPSISVLANIVMPMDFCNLYTPAERRERAMHLLGLVDIAEHAYKRPTEISGGQQQRAAIARAMANDPPIIIADEPTGNLDRVTADQVLHVFEELVRREHKTLIIVTHDKDLAKRADRKVLLVDGQIIDEHMHDEALAAFDEDESEAAD